MVPLIIKLGGSLLDTPSALQKLFTALQHCQQHSPRPLLLVHGGGCLVDELMHKLSLPVVKKEGLRVTPPEQIAIITGALAGTANKTLQSWAIKYQLNPIGLCLADGGSVRVTQINQELGHVASARPGSPQLLQTLLKEELLPVISSIGITAQGELMNVNADQAATALAQTLQADLILLSDVCAILDAKGDRISEISTNSAQQLISEGVITAGMAVKVKAALDVAQALGKPVEIAGWQQAEQLETLMAGGSIGTRVIA
ncbi:MAG: acetylglutamate kinase [Enterobacteriaceae bacterium]